MRILIVGAGSIGLLCGAYFRANNHQVTFLTNRENQAEAIRENGFTIIGNESSIYSAHAFSTSDFIPKLDLTINQSEGASTVVEDDQQPLETTTLLPSIDDRNRDIDLVLITVKQNQLQEVLIWLKKNVKSNVPLIFLMNGLGHQQRINEILPHSSSYYAITNNGSTKISDNEVEERGRGTTIVGALSTHNSKVTESVIVPFLQSLNQEEELWKWSEKMELVMWRKCIINACINPLTALFQVHNGYLLENERAYDWMRLLYEELSEYIKKNKPKSFSAALIKEDLLWNELVDVCKLTFHNYSSMNQDIAQKRETEIEAITGFFIRDAQDHGMKIPHHQTMYNSIKILENLAGKV